jgi:hypothetical protein
MSLSINNVTRVGFNLYQVDFSANFALTDLFYEISSDGITWSSPISIPTTTPQTITVANMVNFKIRLSTNFTPTPPLETGFLMINNNDNFLINDTDSLKYTN